MTITTIIAAALALYGVYQNKSSNSINTAGSAANQANPGSTPSLSPSAPASISPTPIPPSIVSDPAKLTEVAPYGVVPGPNGTYIPAYSPTMAYAPSPYVPPTAGVPYSPPSPSAAIASNSGSPAYEDIFEKQLIQQSGGKKGNVV